MNRLPDNLFRKDLNLEKRWWHRLAKIFFIIFSVIVLVSSIPIFYSAEAGNARQYKIIKTFDEYVQEVKTNCAAQLDGFSCYLLIIPNFLRENTLKDYSLGCLVKNGRVEYLSEFSFEENLVCDGGPNYNCVIPKSICGGDASNIVKYDYEIKYGFSNYLSIAVKTLGVFLGWILLTHLIYYKALLYIIFGGKKHADNS